MCYFIQSGWRTPSLLLGEETIRRSMSTSRSLFLSDVGKPYSLLVDFFFTLLQVPDSTGNATQFKIKSATALKKLMSTYCERAGLDVQVGSDLLCKSFTCIFSECSVHLRWPESERSRHQISRSRCRVVAG